MKRNLARGPEHCGSVFRQLWLRMCKERGTRRAGPSATAEVLVTCRAGVAACDGAAGGAGLRHAGPGAAGAGTGNKCTAVRKAAASPLRELTRHTGSHTVLPAARQR